jgi:hypothetical protein
MEDRAETKAEAPRPRALVASKAETTAPGGGVTPAPDAPIRVHGPASLLRLQRLAGNRAVRGLVTASRPSARRSAATSTVAVQRHPAGTELPQKDSNVSEIETGNTLSATRTPADAKKQVGDASKEGSSFQKAQKLTPGAMSLAGAQKILQGTFGGVKDIVPGSIVILPDQPACAAKYDELSMAKGILRPDGSAWKAGDCAKDDAIAGVTTEGFAADGVVYVNGKTTLVTATAHEILHNNTGAGFRTKMGETFNEGTTELLARQSLKDSGVKVPAETAYPTQVSLTTQLKELLGTKTLTDAYFNGPDALIAAYEKLKGADSWATLKALAEALDVGKAMKAMSKSLKSLIRRK